MRIDWRDGQRLLVLVFVLSLLQPAPILITPGPLQTVHTTHPILGVHTRLTDEVEEWKIQRTLQMVRQMGATSIVEFFPWAYYQAADGGVAWEHPDKVVNHAVAQGVTIVARIGLTPDWARPADTPLTYLGPESYDDFAAFCALFAARYAGKVGFMVVGNEPNLSYEWGYRATTAAEYVALLKAVATAVRAVNPDMVILAGALAPTLEPAGSPWGLNDLTYLQEMYEAGAAPYFDGLAVHVYGLTFPPEFEPSPDVLNFRRVELMRQIMLNNHDETTSIYITETGWNDHPRWSHAVHSGQRITYTLDAITFAETHWPYVKMLNLWAFRLPAPSKSYMDYYMLVTPEFFSKPIYEALRQFTGNE